jgi:protein-serine/threonine kinase
MTNLQPRTPPPAQRRRGDVEDSPENVLGGLQSAATATNSRNADLHAAIPLYSPQSGVTFRSTTIAPSPPPTFSTILSKPPALAVLETTLREHNSESLDLHPSPISAGLRLQTDLIPACTITSATDSNVSPSRKSSEFGVRQPTKPIGVPISRTPSVKQAFANSVGSNSNYGGSAPNSALSSPLLSAMTDVTPLPSPLMSGDSPGPWKKLASRPSSREYAIPRAPDSTFVTTNGESISSAIMNQSKRRAYHGLIMNASEMEDPLVNREKLGEGHQRNRSVSEYVPDSIQAPKGRHQNLSGSHSTQTDTPESGSSSEPHMRREPHLAVKRGLAPIPRPPTPPSSRTGGESSDSDSSLSNKNGSLPRPHRKGRYEFFDANTLADNKRRRWRGLRLLGEGTFSKVVLATSQLLDHSDRIDEDDVFGQRMDGIVPADPQIETKKLVAIKICEHGPKGGASEERVEMSLKRELEIMKSIHHPSLVDLKAWSIEDTRAILVLSYCAGGDLFDLASQHRELLVPSLIRRIFSELVMALQYLHERHIVHRDVKLESRLSTKRCMLYFELTLIDVLVNLPQAELAKDIDWVTYPYSVITLTDLGLSRRVADDEKLTTRCGSDDYAAPEVIMGQSYDGRMVDAWSLGVLLYALLESRLPFDPSPGMSEGHKQRSKTSHRIARVEWCWVKYAGNDGDHECDEAMFEAAGLKGAMEVTEGLLKRARSRWTITKVAAQLWVKQALQIEGALKFREEDTPEEVDTTSIL